MEHATLEMRDSTYMPNGDVPVKRLSGKLSGRLLKKGRGQTALGRLTSVLDVWKTRDVVADPESMTLQYMEGNVLKGVLEIDRMQVEVFQHRKHKHAFRVVTYDEVSPQRARPTATNKDKIQQQWG